MEFSIREGFDADVYVENAIMFGNLLDNYYPEAFDDDHYDFSSMFESEGSTPDNPEGAVKTGFIESIKKAYKAMIDNLKAIIEKCKNAIVNKFASAEAKTKVKELQALIDANPELKGMKVTVADYDKMNQVYAEAVKKAEAAYKKAEEDDADTAEFKKQLDAIKETTTKAIPTAIKTMALGAAAAVLAGLVKNMNYHIDDAGKTVDKLSKNLEKTISKIGKPSPIKKIKKAIKKKGNSRSRAAGRRTALDSFLAFVSCDKTKKSSNSVVRFFQNVKGAVNGDQRASTELKSNLIRSKKGGIRNLAAGAMEVASAWSSRKDNKEVEEAKAKAEADVRAKQAKRKANQAREKAEDNVRKQYGK